MVDVVAAAATRDVGGSAEPKQTHKMKTIMKSKFRYVCGCNNSASVSSETNERSVAAQARERETEID